MEPEFKPRLSVCRTHSLRVYTACLFSQTPLRGNAGTRGASPPVSRPPPPASLPWPHGELEATGARLLSLMSRNEHATCKGVRGGVVMSVL